MPIRENTVMIIIKIKLQIIIFKPKKLKFINIIHLIKVIVIHQQEELPHHKKEI